MTPSQILNALSQLTLRNAGRIVILVVLAIIGAVTAALELILGLHEFPVRVQSALEAALGLFNAILQLAFTLEKLVILHKTFVSVSEPGETPNTDTSILEADTAAPLPSPDSATARIQMSRSARAPLTLRISASSSADTASLSRYQSTVSMPRDEI